MNKSYFILLLLIFPVLSLSAQSGKQKKADRLYNDFAYTKAIELYKDLLEKDYNTAENTEKLADAYYRLRDPENAVHYYASVVDQPGVSPETYYRYAQMLRGVREYEKSREWLKKYQQEGKNPKQVAEILNDDEIAVYDGLETYRVKPAPFNTQYSDFGTFIADDAVYFVSARGEADTKTKIYDWTGEPFLDIYKTSGSSVMPVSGDVNTVRHEGPLTISADGKTMYFTRNNYLHKRNGKKDKEGVNHLKIYRASRQNGKWDNIEELPFDSDSYSVGHPSLSADGKTLYFASEAPGGMGGSDIYKVSVENGTFGTPENMGPKVNTAGNEVFPFIAKNGNFYFSSDGHKGFGLLDVFVLTAEDNKVQNLGEPVNSSLDDFAFSYAAEDESKGYVSSNRPGGQGGDDIFEMDILAPLVLKGRVIDSINKKPIANATVRLMDQNNKQIAFLETDEDGNYSVEVARDKIYPLEAKHIKYNTKTKQINTSNMDEKTQLVYDIELAPVNDVEYLAEINKIYFDFDKSNIRDDAAKELDKLVNLMKNEYPDLVIEIGSYTDKRGSVAYNKKLAERRAQSTFDYLVAHGIEPERIVTYKGYGEENPDVDCTRCSEEQHQLNRRSIFNVVKMN
ncbi:MAG: OmpA family protein [Salinimicrobium sp.]